MVSRAADKVKQKKKLQQETDVVMAIGKKGKEGDKYAKEYFKDTEAKLKILCDIEAAELGKKKSKLSYNTFLANLLIGRLNDIVDGDYWKAGWKYRVAPSEVGVVLELESPTGKLFRNAFASCGDGFYDLNAVNKFTMDVVNTMDKHGKSGSGIIT